MDKHQVTGRLKEAEGKVKEETGKLFGNKTLEEKGKLEKNASKAQAQYGDMKSDSKKEQDPRRG